MLLRIVAGIVLGAAMVAAGFVVSYGLKHPDVFHPDSSQQSMIASGSTVH